MNKIAGYRRMLGLTQNDIAEIFGISTQAYRMKEVGKVNFNKKEDDADDWFYKNFR